MSELQSSKAQSSDHFISSWIGRKSSVLAPRASTVIKIVLIIFFLKCLTSLPPNVLSIRLRLNLPNLRRRNPSTLTVDSKHILDTPSDFDSYFNMTPTTTLNFMHFHKTGGTSIRLALYELYGNATRVTGGGVQRRDVSIQDACYLRPPPKNGKHSSDLTEYMCSWDPVRYEMAPGERILIDLSFGHQFLHNGLQSLIPERDLRSFTFLRHPFDRKLSAYFHFMIRHMGKNEEDVNMSNIRDFLLYEKGNKGKGMKLDVGPNYLAGRMLASGFRKFKGIEMAFNTGTQTNRPVHKWFLVNDADRQQIVLRASTIMENFLLVGLQNEKRATKCMVGKLLQSFDRALGIRGESGEEGVAHRFDDVFKVANEGSYNLRSRDIWNSLSADDKLEFEQHEWIDLQLYKKGVQLFRSQVDKIGCGEYLSDNDPETTGNIVQDGGRRRA